MGRNHAGACLVKRGNAWHAKWRESNGTQRMRSLHTTSEREARRALREIELLLEEEKPVHILVQEKPRGRDPLVDEFWPKYLEWAESNRRPRTVECNVTWWTQFMAVCKAKRLGDVTRKDIERFIQHKLGQGVKKGTVNNPLVRMQLLPKVLSKAVSVCKHN